MTEKSPRRQRNKKTSITPLDIFTRVMQGDESITDRQFDAAKVAAPYLHPKLAGLSMNAVIRRSVEEFSDDELNTLAQTGTTGRLD